MRALDPEVKDAIWAAVEPLIPAPADAHPLGRHRRRKSNRDCFEVMVVRLATGCSWVDAERLCGNKVSDTTVRSRRDEWQAAGVFDAVMNEAIAGFDRIIGLELSDVSADGSVHKSPCGGEGTGPNPTDRAKLGWKWSILVDAKGIPFGVAIDGANRHDSILLEPTLSDASRRGLLADVETLWLDRGYDSKVTRDRLAKAGISDAVIAKKRKPGSTLGRPGIPGDSRAWCRGLSCLWFYHALERWYRGFSLLYSESNIRTVPRGPADLFLVIRTGASGARDQARPGVAPRYAPPTAPGEPQRNA